MQKYFVLPGGEEFVVAIAHDLPGNQSNDYYLATEVDAALAAKDARIAELQARLDWAANELLVCDYGDNGRHGRDQIGWIVYGWRHKNIADMRHADKPRIFGSTINAAIDAEIESHKVVE